MVATGELTPGQAVGPYEIKDIIGRGRMGRVYRATGPDGEQVALKTITTEIATDPTFVRRFHREAAAARRIEHPNIVPVLDEGEEAGTPFLVQRLVPGGTLADLIAKRQRLELADTVDICAQVAAGLDALHASGLVHRDVKPANILLDGAGGALISDFGLAKDEQASVLTQPGQALGSLDYMAPEQIRGEKVDPTTDVYALGCVLYECVLGTPPFGGRPSMRTLFAHMQEPPPELSVQRPDIPETAARAALRGLAKDPAERPPSASGYISAIAQAAGVRPR
jgi:serine/threonine protein kinase